MTTKITIGYKESESGVVLIAELHPAANEVELMWSRQAMTYVHRIMDEHCVDAILVPHDLTTVAEISITASGDDVPKRKSGGYLTSRDGDLEDVGQYRYKIEPSINIGTASNRLGGMLEPHVVVAITANNMLIEAINAVSTT
jgi:hypothetical protein